MKKGVQLFTSQIDLPQKQPLTLGHRTPRSCPSPEVKHLLNTFQTQRRQQCPLQFFNTKDCCSCFRSFKTESFLAKCAQSQLCTPPVTKSTTSSFCEHFAGSFRCHSPHTHTHTCSSGAKTDCGTRVSKIPTDSGTQTSNLEWRAGLI